MLRPIGSLAAGLGLLAGLAAAPQLPAADKAAPQLTSGPSSESPKAPRVRKRNGTNRDVSLTHAGLERVAILHLPSAPEPAKPRPLVIVLHGLMTTAAMTQAMTRFDQVADEHDFLVVYPDGVGKMWRFWEGTGRKPPNRDLEVVDDPGYLLHLVDTLAEEKLIDRRRVYMTGFSNGGFMANRMAWEYGDRIAAIASVAGSIPNQLLDAKPIRPVPTLLIHGTEDAIVDFGGSQKFGRGTQFVGARDVAKWWAGKNHCGSPEATLLPNTCDDGTLVRQVRYPAGASGGEVCLLEITGGGHTWPGKVILPKAIVGTTCQDFSASEAIWEFCSKQALPEQLTTSRAPSP